MHVCLTFKRVQDRQTSENGCDVSSSLVRVVIVKGACARVVSHKRNFSELISVISVPSLPEVGSMNIHGDLFLFVKASCCSSEIPERMG